MRKFVYTLVLAMLSSVAVAPLYEKWKVYIAIDEAELAKYNPGILQGVACF